MSRGFRHWRRLGAGLLLVGGSWGVLDARPAPPPYPAAVATDREDPALPDWNDSMEYAQGTLPASASSYPFETREKAMMGHRTKSARFLLLSGDWQFNYAPDIARAPAGFERPDFDASAWPTITVPGDWASAGYGGISTEIPLRRTGGGIRIDPATNPVGSYRRDFVVPETWQGSDVTLEIAGTGSAYAVWVNGARVGFVQDGKLPGDFDVTRHIRAGHNIIAVQVYRWSSGSLLESSEAHNATGIDREVILVAAPKTRIRDFFVHAGLDARFTNGKLAVDFAVTPGEATTASFTLLDATMHEVLTRSEPLSAAASARAVTLRADVPNVQLWSAETPYLYKILVELRDARGALLQSTYARVGFRTITAQGGRLFVNGRAVVLRGAVRHELDGASLHSVAGPAMERDLKLMKQSGVNAIRTAYPNDAHFYELADRYGFYVLDEPNLDGREIGRWGLERSGSPGVRAWRAAELARVLNLVERDKNHASIIAWSTGLERGRDAGAAMAAAAIAKRDPGRLVVCCRNALDHAWAGRWNTPIDLLPNSLLPVPLPPSFGAPAPSAARKEQ